MEDIARFATRLVVFREGQLAMDGPPGEVFARAEELESMGLTVPGVTKVMGILRRKGVDVPAGVFTVHQALDALRRLKGGDGRA